MRNTAHQTRENRTITVDFRSEATYFQWLGDGKAFLECVLTFVMALGFQEGVAKVLICYLLWGEISESHLSAIE